MFDNKQYYIDNREKILESGKQYRNDHRLEYRARKKQERLNNLEHYRQKEREASRRRINKIYYPVDPKVIKNRKLKKQYGITLNEYNEMYNKQEGKCLICNELFPILCIDHNHLTNKIRGLLCHQCNLMIGNSGENIKILENAILYINNQ
jgi:hypothetical protein